MLGAPSPLPDAFLDTEPSLRVEGLLCTMLAPETSSELFERLILQQKTSRKSSDATLKRGKESFWTLRRREPRKKRSVPPLSVSKWCRARSPKQSGRKRWNSRDELDHRRNLEEQVDVKT